jgi:hypothetical protein
MLGLVPRVSFKDSPLIVDVSELQTHVAQVFPLFQIMQMNFNLDHPLKNVL